MINENIFILIMLGAGLFAIGLSLGIHAACRRAEKNDQEKSTFVANLSHEIRSPVGVMMGFADLLIDPSCPEEERLHYARIMKRNGQSLLTLIDDILDFSKIDAGKLKIKMSKVDLHSLIREVASIYQPRAEGKGISFEFKLDPLVPQFITSDAVRLRQILTNVLGNAIKFTNEGSVSFSVHHLPVLNDKHSLRLGFEVKDTGLGMKSDEIKKIFQPFVQCEAAEHSQQGGAGLGLALSKKLAQALSGDIELKESHLHQGSVFLITLETDLPPEKREGRLEGLKILLADDAADNRSMVQWLLIREGAVVEVAGDGREAVAKALAMKPDLILMDLQMPVMDGLSATTALRQQGFDKPILALTGYSKQEDRERCRKAGLNEHISKPIQKESFISLLAKYLPARLAC